MTKTDYKLIKKELSKSERTQIDEVLKGYGKAIGQNDDIIEYLEAEDVDFELIEKLKEY